MTATKMEEIELGGCPILDKIKDCFSLYWNNIRNNLYPKQRYLYKVIPAYEAEKSQLMEDLIFAVLVEFVEKDTEKFNSVPEWVRAEILECYEWIKIRSVEEELELDRITDEYHHKLSDNEVMMDVLGQERMHCIDMRDTLNQKNNTYLCKIIGLRHHMTW